MGFVWFCLGFKLNITNVNFSCLFTPCRNLNLYTSHLTLRQPTELRGLMAPLRRWVVKQEEEVALPEQSVSGAVSQ